VKLVSSTRHTSSSKSTPDARAAIDASEFARAREALAPLTDAPTQRVAMLMAEIERTEHGDSGRARAWTLRAVRALHDPVWTADGYVSDRWRPVSPVTGRLDAFQWQRPLAALPSDKNAAIEAAEFNAAISAPRRVEPPRDAPIEPAPSAAQDNSPVLDATVEPASIAAPTPTPTPTPMPAPAPTPKPQGGHEWVAMTRSDIFLPHPSVVVVLRPSWCCCVGYVLGRMLKKGKETI